MNESSVEQTNSYRYVIGSRVDAVNYEQVIAKIFDWADKGESRYICIANVHMLMEAHDDLNFKKQLNSADMVTPDGMPLVWALRKLGLPNQQQVCGPDLTPMLCDKSQNKYKVGLFGGRPEALDNLKTILKDRFPNLSLAYVDTPPYRELTPEEDEKYTKDICDSGVNILFVGLGCPKQEKWMANHRGRVPAVMIGVGAAFDFMAGTVKRSPRWMSKLGIEWLFRLIKEPKRLWKRYFKHNPRYLFLLGLQLMGWRKFDEVKK